MEFEDFKIGEAFWAGSGKWMVLDKGQESIVATRWSNLIDHPSSHPADICNWHEYDLIVFFDDDFGGCDTYNRFLSDGD